MRPEIGGASALCSAFGETLVKSARFNRLLISTALGLVLVLGSHASMAQQSDQRIRLGCPDAGYRPAAAADGEGRCGYSGAAEAKPAETKTEAKTKAKTETKTAEPKSAEPKQDVAAPAAEPAKAAAIPTAAPVTATADSAVADRLREMITGKQSTVSSAARPTAKASSRSTRRATTSRCG